MQNLMGLWDSYQALSTVGTVLKFIAAISGMLVLIFGLRESSIRKKAQDAEKITVDQRIEKAEAATRPRRLRKDQKDLLVRSLSALDKKPKIFISAGVLDQESVTFGEDIEAVLLAAGFAVHFPKGFEPDASIATGPPGLHLVVKDPTVPNKDAARIQKCFMNAGVQMLGLRSSESDFPDDKIEVVVGQR